jgi:hypothetical protein
MNAKQIYVSQEGYVVHLDFRELKGSSAKIKSRVEEIIPILQAIVIADTAWSKLSEKRTQELFLPLVARDLMYQAFLVQAMGEAELIADVASGRKPRSVLGFPEFQSAHPEHD